MWGEPMNNEEAMKMIQATAAQLGEHFEAVQILVSRPQEGGGGTHCVKSGIGNWYARQGMAHEFIEEDKAQEHAAALGSRINPPE